MDSGMNVNNERTAVLHIKTKHIIYPRMNYLHCQDEQSQPSFGARMSCQKYCFPSSTPHAPSRALSMGRVCSYPDSLFMRTREHSFAFHAEVNIVVLRWGDRQMGQSVRPPWIICLRSGHTWSSWRLGTRVGTLFFYFFFIFPQYTGKHRHGD